jgi:hypothetical protein
MKNGSEEKSKRNSQSSENMIKYATTNIHHVVTITFIA